MGMQIGETTENQLVVNSRNRHESGFDADAELGVSGALSQCLPLFLILREDSFGPCIR